MTTRAPTPDILGDIMAGATVAAVAPTTTVPLAAIVNDGGTQMRAGMDAATITEYEEAINGADGWPFPPVVVFHDGEKYWLADGFHRVNAAHRSGKHTAIPAEVKAGTRRDAILYAAGANAAHGLRRTNGDKRRAVEVLLKDVEWSQWSNVEIAKRCAVAESSVRNIRAELERTSQIAKSVVRTGADGRVYNTQNIGSNRPARLFVGDLKGLVAKWMGMHWQHAWPDNPSHTNGEFWQQLTAWMHENVRETWHEGDLKEAIKDIHYVSTRAANRPAIAPAPAATPVAAQQPEQALKPIELPSHADAETRARFSRARHASTNDLVNIFGYGFGFHPKPPYGDGMVDLVHHDREIKVHRKLGVFATDDEATQAARRDLQERIAAAVPSLETSDDLHQGAGRTAPPAMSVAELVEDLDGYLTGIPAAEIDQAAKGANNRALQTAQTCLQDFTYRQADLHRALQRLALQRGAALARSTSSATEGAEEPVVNGDRPLPEWAAPVVRQAQEPAPAVAPNQHPQHDELAEFSELFKLAIKEVRKWGALTGLHTEILEAERGLRHLIERTESILKDFDHVAE